MENKNVKNIISTKSSSPYPERKKRPRLKFAWNKEEAIDYDNNKQIDNFIQDVIEKAKGDYLKIYSNSNGQCSESSYSDIRNHNGIDSHMDTQEQLCADNSAKNWNDTRNGNSNQENIEMKNVGCVDNQGERKPLINKTGGRQCCSEHSLCSRLFIMLTCYHCRCLQNILNDS